MHACNIIQYVICRLVVEIYVVIPNLGQEYVRKNCVALHTIKQSQGRMQYGSHGLNAINNYK